MKILPPLLLSLFVNPPTAASHVVKNDSLLIELDYGTFRGAYSAAYNLTYYRKIPFGASTAAQNRFRAPQPPSRLPPNTVYDTDQAFDMCPQRTMNGSEDCLYLGVYSRPWGEEKKRLRPVLLTFYGGGFIRGSATFDIPPSGFPVLNVSEMNDYVVLYSNYRTNVFGFLSGSKIGKSEEVDLNIGLLDQKAALEWIQKYIGQFGGDAGNVTIWGQSAGGGSVVAQTIAQGEKRRGQGKLFTKAMAHSPFWPKTYRFDAPENEELYEKVVQGVGCNNTIDEIKCLKTVDVQKLRDISSALESSHQYTTSTFTWGPVIDNDFLSAPLSDVVRKGKGALNAEMVFTNYNLHEGENFIPPGFSSKNGSAGYNSSFASFDTWLSGFLPGLSEVDLGKVKAIYPASGTAEELKWNSTYERAGIIYRDIILACPAYWLANTAEKGWLSEYTISPAKHASDTIYWNTLNPVQQSDPLTYDAFTGAMASFIQTGYPDAHKVINSGIVGVPGVGEGKQFVVRSGGVAQENISMLEERCAFWLSVAGKVGM